MLAVGYGDKQAVEALLAHGADVNARDHVSQTCFSHLTSTHVINEWCWSLRVVLDPRLGVGAGLYVQ